MSQGWFISAGGQEAGPFATEVVLEMIRAGQLRDDDTISTDRTVWVTVADYRASMPLVVGAQFAQPQPVPLAPAPLPPAVDALSALANQGMPPGGALGVGVPPLVPPAVPPAMAAPAAAVTGAPPAPVGGGRRERIVVLGRRAAGKTVYLATLYARLWNSLDGLTMTSTSGLAHRDTMRLVDGLTRGQWPPATLDNTLMAIEVKYRRRTRLMVSMDYSGEVFRRAFVEDAADNSPQTRELLDHLDHAGAVMLLLDPRVAYEHSKDIEASVDDDFGMVQAVRRIRNAPDGHEVPVALTLTKMDQNLDLIKKEGGAANFVRNHWPALTRTLKHLVIFMVSAVQIVHDEQGRPQPRQNSDPINVENPLKYCLKEMGKIEDVRDRMEMITHQEQQLQLQIEMATAEDRKQKLFWATVIAGILLLGAFVVAAIIVFS